MGAARRRARPRKETSQGGGAGENRDLRFGRTTPERAVPESTVFDSEKEQVRDRVPIEDVIREYNVQLIRAGRGFKALCPFHSEKTPSFHVNTEGQYFRCFGCQERGDVFSFVQKMERVDFPQALELLARRAGVELSRRSNRTAGDRENVVRMYDALELARDFYHRYLLEAPAAHPAREYLERRGIGRDAWKDFHLGFSPTDGRALLQSLSHRGIDLRVLVGAGLAREARGGHRDAFHGRIMFPISNTQKRPVGFGARTLGGDEPKYLNTAKTELFDKSRLLYGLAEGRQAIHQSRELVLVEGYTDVITAHQAGLRNVVASLGTAFTEENARQLARLGDRAWLVFDGDRAGQSALERSLDLLVAEDIDVQVCSMPDGRDPCDVIQDGGADAFRANLNDRSASLFEFKWRRTLELARETEGGANAEARAIDEYLRLVGRVPNPVTRRLHIREFAERVGVDETTLGARLRTLTKPTARPRPGNPTDESNASARSSFTASAGERELALVLLECLLALPHNAAEIWTIVPKEVFRRSGASELVDAIDRRLAAGEFSPDGLLREVSSEDAQKFLILALSRVQSEETDSTDHEERWKCARRDIERYRLTAEIHALDRQIEVARREADREGYQSLLRARLEAKKRLKRLKGAPLAVK